MTVLHRIVTIIFISSSWEDVLSLPMDHTPIRSIPATGLWLPPLGLGMMLNRSPGVLVGSRQWQPTLPEPHTAQLLVLAGML